MAEPFNIVYLPEHILIQIFSYMSYSEVSESRRVCQTFNRVCSRELTKAFVRVDRLHSQIQKQIKSQLPRKESERRNHALSRFVDILSAMETRLSLLSMTYTKYIDLDLCCFIPGKVLDEMYRLLRRLQNTDTQPPRSYDLLQSLRDLSTMAMEHFEEFIVPILKAQMNDCSQSLYFSASSTSSPLPLNSTMGSGPFASSLDMSGVPLLDYSWAMPIPLVSTPWRRTPLKLDVQRVQNQVLDALFQSTALKLDVQLMESQMQMHSAAIATMTKEYREQKVKIGEQSRIIAEQDRKLQEQCRLMSELKAHMQAQEKNMEILVAHMAKATGKEVALPETKPWDQTLWEHLPRPSTSPQDGGVNEETSFVHPEMASTPKRVQYRQILAECEANTRPKEAKAKMGVLPKTDSPLLGQLHLPGYPRLRGLTGYEDMPVHEHLAYMNELTHSYSSACPTQRLLPQIALLIQSHAAQYSLPVGVDEAAEVVVDAKDSSSIMLNQLTTAQQQLTTLYEEHAGCPLCSQASTSAYAHLLPSTSSREMEGFASHPATNQGLVNRAQELYNRLQNFHVIAVEKPAVPEPAAVSDEEASAEPVRGRGKGKGPLKRGRSVSKVKDEAGDDGKAEPTGRGRKRRRR